MKLWQKNTGLSKDVEEFTVGRDKEFDLQLAPFDIIGSIAHTKMLASVGLLKKDEADELTRELRNLYKSAISTGIKIDEGVEDIHSQVELLLTNSLGDTGKKIHAARSRNDQVAVDIRLFLRKEIESLVNAVIPFFDLLQAQSEKFKDHLYPGYTHLQVAMPSSFGLWFGAYAESLSGDLVLSKAAYDLVNRNPLGSAAGYGSSFPINRSMTSDLLGFAGLDHNVVYAQMTRGKMERIVAMALANIAESLARLSMDACLYMGQDLGFISFPDDLTTGSSIMPHKKNPDVFELIRSHCNRIKALPNEIMMMTTNLPSGYHRDLQLLKEHLFPAFETLRSCLDMAGLMLSHISIRKNILDDKKYDHIFSVEEVNKLVNNGMPFRDAYKKVAADIESGNFHPDRKVVHTHEGSIGNLQNAEIRKQMQTVIDSFHFEAVNAAMENLLTTL